MAKQQPATEKVEHLLGTDRGEEQVLRHGREAGRIREGHSGANRPVGKSTPRDVTSINPEDRRPINPESPFLIPA
jgi:hypothetical protein